MQLTWDYNYKDASAYLYGDDRLLRNPDSVGEDPEVGWATVCRQLSLIHFHSEIIIIIVFRLLGTGLLMFILAHKPLDRH
jgi:hypothetical protein